MIQTVFASEHETKKKKTHDDSPKLNEPLIAVSTFVSSIT